MIGVRGNSSAHVIDAALVIGPLKFLMDKKAGLLLQQSRVSMTSLSARLRMTVSNDLTFWFLDEIEINIMSNFKF